MFPGGLRLDTDEEEAAVAAVREVMRSKRLFRYHGAKFDPLRTPRVDALEHAFAERLDVPHTLAVNSGTSALVCALAALDIGPGDEVVVPAYTWVSTASAVIAVGAVPVIAEVDDSLTLDPADVRRKLSPQTRAIIPVHMRGAPARLDEIERLARESGLHLIEDVAQAAGASFAGRPLGSIGDAGAFSFQMSKMLTAGEGGLVTMRDRCVYQRALMYNDSAICAHAGVSMEEWIAGVNLRMSELQAAVLLVQLARLESLVADTRARKARLKALVREPLEERGVRFRTIHDPDGETSIALIFFLPDATRVADLVAMLGDDNVPATRLYHDLESLPRDHVDLHVATAWSSVLARRSWSRSGEPWRGHPRSVEYSADMWPATTDLLRRAVHIDVSPELTEKQVDEIGNAIVQAVERCL
jgi:dTDP-4-amino-4,6-dideoxygalactose transaminase